MPRLLIHENSLKRVGESLARVAGVEYAVFAEDGTVTVNGRPADPATLNPEVGWYATDLYLSRKKKEFMQIMQDSPALAWVHVSAAGLEHPAYVKLFAKGVKLTTSHEHSVSIGEYVLANVLDHFQRGPERRAQQASRTWKPLYFREIHGSRWLLIGFGAIGQAVAARAVPFGAKITAIRRDQRSHPLAEQVAPVDDLAKHLPQADVVVLSVPLTPATTHMANGDFLSAMKEGSVLVNVGRGGLVDDAALLAALDAGKPAHAILDVFVKEPLPAESPYWGHPRVTVTTHTAGVTDNLFPRNDALFIANLRRYLAGEDLPHQAKADDLNG